MSLPSLSGGNPFAHRSPRGSIAAYLPATILFGALFVSFLPLTPLFGTLPPFDAALMALYFWLLRGTQTPGLPAIFALGLLADCLSGAPIGFHILVYLGCAVLVETQQPYARARGFLFLWGLFALLCVVKTLFAWVSASLLLENLLAFWPFLAEGALTVALYPLFARIFFMLEALVRTRARVGDDFR